VIRPEELEVPAWHPPELAEHARELLHIWSAVGEPDCLRAELQRVLLDSRLKLLWPEIEERFLDSQPPHAEMRSARFEWSELQRELLAELVTKGGETAKKTVTAMRGDRGEIGAIVRKLRSKIASTEDPTLTDMRLSTLLRRLARRSGESANTARAMPDTCQWLASGIRLDDLLGDLQGVLESGEEFADGDPIAASPFEGRNRGAATARLAHLESRLMHLLGRIRGAAKIVEQLAAIALDVDTTRRSDLRGLLAAKKASKNRG